MGIVNVYLVGGCIYLFLSTLASERRIAEAVIEQYRENGYWVEVDKHFGIVFTAEYHTHGPDEECTSDCGLIHT